jgi:membrane fusion protein (multidrug efflux system)
MDGQPPGWGYHRAGTFMRNSSSASLSFLLGLSLIFAACGSGPAADGNGANAGGESAEAPTPTPEVRERTYLTSVLTRQVERGQISASIATTGSLIPGRSVAVRVEEAGRLHFERPWRQGDIVEAGTLLARIESPALEREKEIREADVEIQLQNLDLGQRTLENRIRDYQSLQDLYARGISAQREVDSARLELERARNSQRQNQINLARAEASLRELDDRFEALTIEAPFTGMIVSRSTLEGQGKFQRGFGQEAITDYEGLNVSVGHVVCGLIDHSQMIMRCDVTSKDVGAISLGQEAEVAIYAQEDIRLTGQVAAISSNVNPDTRAFDVDILLPNPDGLLKPGMFGRAEIVTERRLDVIAVPRSVVTRRSNRDVVFIVDQPADAPYEIAKMVPVDLGLEGREDIEITFGLRSGDRIIVRGFEVLQDSTPIRPIDEDAPITREDFTTPEVEEPATEEQPVAEATPEAEGSPAANGEPEAEQAPAEDTSGQEE